MSISSKEIRFRLKVLWPGLSSVWLTDPNYKATPSTISRVLSLWEGELNKYGFKKNIVECEEFALFCHAFVKQHQIFNYNDNYNWAYGECIASRIMGDDYVHSCNLYLTRDSIYMAEPQTGAYWEADPELDTVFFVKM